MNTLFQFLIESTKFEGKYHPNNSSNRNLTNLSLISYYVKLNQIIIN